MFALINLATHGYWYLSIIRANINAFDAAQALIFFRQWTELHRLIAAVAAVRLLYEIYPGRLSAYGVWFAFALANGALSGKFGAGESYFVTATAAACALSGITLARLAARLPAWLRANAPNRLALPAAGALLAAIPLLYLVQARLTLHLPTTGLVYGPVARALGVASELRLLMIRRATRSLGRIPPRPTALPATRSPRWPARRRAPCFPKKPGSCSGPASRWSPTRFRSW